MVIFVFCAFHEKFWTTSERIMDLQYLIYLIYLGESVIFHHPKTIIIRNPKHTFHGLYLDTRLSIVPQDLGRMEHSDASSPGNPTRTAGPSQRFLSIDISLTLYISKCWAFFCMNQLRTTQGMKRANAFLSGPILEFCFFSTDPLLAFRNLPNKDSQQNLRPGLLPWRLQNQNQAKCLFAP